jgi:hypothetical protein
MRRLILGITLGVLLGSATAAVAGFFYTAPHLLALRSGGCGDAAISGYVAGIFDVMAAWYPVSQARLGDVTNDAIQDLLRASLFPDTESNPAAFTIVGTLIRRNDITKEDAARVLPVSALQQLRDQ